MDASDMALKGIVIPSDNGILGCTAERTIQNLGRVSGEGMNNTDNVILDVMLHRCVLPNIHAQQRRNYFE